MKKRFVCFYYCNGLHLSLGLHISFEVPNIEIHLPFGFVRIGWENGPKSEIEHPYRFLYRAWGWQ